MDFSITATATAIAASTLGLAWLLAGKRLLARWAMEANEQSLLVGRRLGAAYLGIAVMLWIGRNAPPSEFRTAATMGMFLALLLLAFLGVLEFKAHRAGAGIIVSVVLEIVLAAGFGWVLLTAAS